MFPARLSIFYSPKIARRLVAWRPRAAYPPGVPRAAYTLAVLVSLCATTAHADLVARSRNSVVFVESTRAGEEWEAFRLVDETHPALFRVEGPGRVLLRLRTLAKVQTIVTRAEVFKGHEPLMTMEVPCTADPEARLSDGGGSVALAKLYLLEVSEGLHTLTVRHTEGPALLVSARFAPPLVTSDTEGEVPLVEPNLGRPEVPRVGALERGGNSFAAGPVKPSVEDRPIQAPLPDGDGDANDTVEPPPSRPSSSMRGPRLEEAPESQPALDDPSQIITRPLNNPARVLLEARAGVNLDRLVNQPGMTVGVDLRGALSGARRPRLLTVGVSLDLVHAQGQEVVRLGPSPVGVARVRHTFGVLTGDLRLQLLRYKSAGAIYASLGGGVLLGRARVATEAGATTAGSSAFLGSLRLGGTLAVQGSRPFLEVRAWAGRFKSELVRPGAAGLAGDDTGWYAMAVVVGWRIEMGFAEQE